MANREFYSSDEFSSAPEYKYFEAEIYKKPNEFRNTTPEFSDNGPESQFTVPPNEELEKKERSENKRLKAKKIFDSLSDSASKILGSVTGTVAAAATVVVVCTTIFAPSPTAKMRSFEVGANYVVYSLELSDLEKDVDYDIVISNPYDTFVHKDVCEGLNENYVVGLRSFHSYTLSLVGKGDGASGTITYYEKTFYTDSDKAWVDEHYDALLETATLDETTVVWGDEENEIVLPVAFETDDGNNFGYHAILLNEQNEEVARYEGQDSFPELVVPANAGKLAVRYEKVFLRDGANFVYESYLSEGFLDLTPLTVEIFPETRVSSHNYYEIPYQINGIFNEDSTYSFIAYVNGNKTNDYLETPRSNSKNTFSLYLTEFPEEFTLYVELTYEAPYGNQSRTARSEELVYRPETQLLAKKHVSYVNANTLFLDFAYHAPIGSYVSVVNEQTGEETISYGGTFEIPVDTASDYTFSYSLNDSSGTPILEREQFTVNTVTDKDCYEIIAQNPGDLLVTQNPDGSCNLFIDVNFKAESPNVYYEITVHTDQGPYVYRSTENLAVIKNLPEDLYSLNYRVYYDTGDGLQHVLFDTTPSGTTEHLPASWQNAFSFDGSTFKVEINESVLFKEDLLILLDNGSKLTFRKEDMQLVNGVYVYSIETEEEFYNATLLYYGNKAKENYELNANKLGKENIQGDPYFKIELSLFGG